MDLMEYRAMKAQEEEAKRNSQSQGNGEQSNAQTLQSTTPPVQQNVPPTEQSQQIPSVTQTQTETQSVPSEGTSNQPNQPEVPQTFELNGQQVTLEELQKGYLRQSDYTRKTQEIARKQRELEYAQDVLNRVKQNPEVQEKIQFDPIQAERDLLEAQRMDMELQREVDTLLTKYADFDVTETLEFALARQLPNLEDAYLLNKTYKGEKPVLKTPSTPQYTQSAPPQTSVDVEALKAQIRQELLAEANTSTIISSQGGTTPVTPSAPTLSSDELRIAQNMKMSPEEYAKWR